MRRSLLESLQSQRAPNLVLSDLVLSDDACRQVADYLIQNPIYKVIEFRGCNVGPTGFSLICRALQGNPVVSQILAEWNTIGVKNEGIGALCDLLQDPACQIVHIDLKNNRITHESCGRLQQMLMQNQKLESLNLKWNEIGERGAQLLLEGLSRNTSLRALDISCNKVPEELASRIRDKIERNKTNEFQTLNTQNMMPQPDQTSQVSRMAFRPSDAQSTPHRKNEQIIVVQLKEQIDQELRENRVLADEMERRMDALKGSVMRKEQTIAHAQNKFDSLLSEKAMVEREHEDARRALDILQQQCQQRQDAAMNKYMENNKHVIALENDYMRELSELRNDNKIQIQEIHQIWAPRLNSLESKYSIIFGQNEEMNAKMLNFKELFLKMRLDHDEGMKMLEQRIVLEEKAKYTHQLDLMNRREAEAQQEVKTVRAKQDELVRDSERLENKLIQEQQQVQDLLQYEREKMHEAHLQISKRSIRQDKLINLNIVQDQHINKLVNKIQDLNQILINLKGKQLQYSMQFKIRVCMNNNRRGLFMNNNIKLTSKHKHCLTKGSWIQNYYSVIKKDIMPS